MLIIAGASATLTAPNDHLSFRQRPSGNTVHIAAANVTRKMFEDRQRMLQVQEKKLFHIVKVFTYQSWGHFRRDLASWGTLCLATWELFSR